MKSGPLWAGRCALPDKMIRDPKGNLVNFKDALHWDWPPIVNKIPRAYNAYGPRCPGASCQSCGGRRYLNWPPLIYEGFDATRWEWCDEQTATTGFRKEIFIPDFRRRLITHEIYQRPWVGITPEGARVSVWLFEEGWGPSIIPTTSEHGWLKLGPGFECRWRTTPSWRKYYYRSGMRPDYVDMYYNKSRIYLGRNPE